MTNQKKIVLIGAGGHAHACIEVVEQQGQYQIAGLVGSENELGSMHFGYSVIATDRDLKELAQKYHYALIALGQIKSSNQRINLYNAAINAGFELPTIIDPSARVSRHATIKNGTIVMQQAIINAGAIVAENCIVNTKALIEHDVTVDKHCHISTGAILNGNVRVGASCFIGSGAIVKQGIRLAEKAVVGMGVSVRHDLKENVEYLGIKQS